MCVTFSEYYNVLCYILFEIYKYRYTDDERATIRYRCYDEEKIIYAKTRDRGLVASQML